jgi:hypothetical protein
MAKTFSAGHDFLPTLGNDVRDLTGLDTLVYELVQNADDAPIATEMRFEVDLEGLTVWNDGVFSDCGDQDSPDCRLVSQNGGEPVRCDFHSFRRISGQAKREKVGTTGAFGLGFTSVFQICDYPELLSDGRHWLLRYDRPEDARIVECEGCGQAHDGPGTTFVLPWARDPETPMRKGMRVGPVEQEIERRFLSEARTAIPESLIFLKRVTKIELWGDPGGSFTFARKDINQWRYVEDHQRGSDDTLYVLQGGFEDEAVRLRALYPSVLRSDRRDATFEIAIPLERPTDRLPLHAVLPTRERVGLGFRLSSSFFPFQDRKRLKFEGESDAESEWNRAAVRAAASSLARSLPDLKSDLGPKELWSLIHAAFDVGRASSTKYDASFGAFWDELRGRVIDSDSIWTASDRWARPEDCVLTTREWDPAIEALDAVGVRVVDPTVRTHVRATAGELGVKRLDADELASAIRDAGVTGERMAPELPGALASEDGLFALLGVVADLIRPLIENADPDSGPIQAFDDCAIIPCLEGRVGSPNLISDEDDHTIALFARAPGLTFADRATIEVIAPQLRHLLWPLQAAEVVEALTTAHHEEELAEAITDVDVREILRWLAERWADPDEADLEETDIEALRELPIFPSAQGLRALSELQLPGPFAADPLGIAETVDLSGIEDLAAFLGEECLRASTLDVNTYVTDCLLPAFKAGDELSPAALDELLDVLSASLRDLDPAVKEGLAALPLLPVVGGSRIAANHAYFDGEIVQRVLGAGSVVDLRQWEWRPLLEDLGVSTEPRPQDVVASIRNTVSEPKSKNRVASVRALVEFLGPKFDFTSESERDEERTVLDRDYGELRSLPWLPVVGSEDWSTPGHVYRTEWRTAFATTGRFVDLPAESVQEPNARFLEFLGVVLRPEPELVVRHLLNCAQQDEPVALRAYRLLDEAAAVRDVLGLRDQECILVSAEPEVAYSKPADVVREPGPLASHLARLPDALVPFENLLRLLSIADRPTPHHAIRVLEAVSAAAGGDPLPADGVELGVVEASWRLLEDERRLLNEEGDLAAAEVDALVQARLAELPCWPDRQLVMRRPRDVLFDDLPALHDSMPSEARQLLVDRPRWGIEVALVAGLRMLSDALVDTVVTAPNEREHDELVRVLGERHDLMERVLVWNDVAPERTELLKRVDLVEVDEIVVHRELREPHHDLGTYSLAAFLDQDGDRLLVAGRDERTIKETAVELARLLCGDVRAASLIGDVLSAPSPEDAHALLDAYRVPRLRDDAVANLPEPPAPQALFTDEEDEGISDDRPAYEVSAHMTRDEPFGSAAVEDVAASCGDTNVEPEDGQGDPPAEPGTEASDSIGGATSGGAPLFGASREVGNRTRDSTGPGSFGRHPGPPKSAVGSRGSSRVPSGPSTPWRLWVSGGSGAAAEQHKESAEAGAHRASAAQAGVERVMAYEEAAGRQPVEMPPNNPGFDVESGPSTGTGPPRLIEVKALAGSWDAEFGRPGHAPQLTAAQFGLSTTD